MKYNWLIKRHLRSVDSLKLWAENPRLNPDGKYLNLLDYVEELLSDNSEKESFVKLLESISKKALFLQTLLLFGEMRTIPIAM